jgi:Family of unknown function (DUF6515)
MRRASIYLIIFLLSGLWLGSAEAQRGRGGGGGGRAGGLSGGGGISRGGGDMQPRVQNRSTGNFNSANVNRGSISSSNLDRTNINRNNINSANVNRNVTNVNRNVNVDRDVDVHGGWNGGYWDDRGWGWGSFAAGAAVGATTAAVGAAAADHNDTVVVAAPPAGTVVATLPSSCTMVGTSGTAIYDCGGAYYRPYYSGSDLVYEVVQNP